MRDFLHDSARAGASILGNLAGSIESLTTMAGVSSFHDRLVPESVLSRLVDLALRMPAEHDLPTGRWIIVRSPAARERVAQAAYGQRVVSEAPVLIVALADLEPERVWGAPERRRRVARGELSPEEARRRSALAERAPGRWPSRGVWAVRHALLTVAALLIGAAEAGLAARLVPDLDHERLREALGIPDDHEIAALVALGYPAAGAKPADSPPSDGLAFAEHFGQPWGGSPVDASDPGSSEP